MSIYRNLTPLQKRAALALAIICSANYWSGATRLVIPYIINQYVDRYDITTIQRLLNIGSPVGMAVGFIAGTLGLKFNKKYLLAGSIGAMALQYAVYFFVGMTNGPLWMLYLGSGLAGVCQGSSLTFINSLISEIFPGGSRATINANLTALMSTGSMLLNSVGGPIAAIDEGAKWYRTYLLGIYIIVAIIAMLIIMPKKWTDDTAEISAKKEENASETTAANEPKFIPAKVFGLVFCGICTSLSLCAWINNTSIFIVRDYELGTSAHAGLASSIYSFTGLFIGVTYAAWQKILGKYIHIFGLALFTAGNFVIYSMGPTSLVSIYAAAVLINGGFCLLNPYYISRVMFNTPKKWLPIALAMSNIGISNRYYFVC